MDLMTALKEILVFCGSGADCQLSGQETENEGDRL